MYSTCSRRPRRSRISPLAGALVVATAVLGLPCAAQAQSPVPAGPKTAPSATKMSVSAACGAAKPGMATCYALRRDDIKATRGVQPAAAPPSGYGPADLRSAYQLPTDGGAGATVAIVDAFDGPTAEADLAIYREQYGLAPCTTANGCFRKVDQRGGTTYPAPEQGWAAEIALDLDMVSAVAPAAHILLIEADSSSFDNLGAAVDEAVALGAKFVTNSYGTSYSPTPGSGEDPTEVTDYDAHYNHPGVAVTVASGDSNYGVSYPAASPYVTAVGGTALHTADNERGWTESVWHNGSGGPGSGCSVYEAKPAFQSDTGCAKRAVTDVSAVSDPATGVAVYQNFGGVGGWAVYGGTSAASPIIAGVYAVAGTPIAGTYPNSYPYDRASALFDVTVGMNGTCSPAYLCTAGAGYDGPTGLGTPAGSTAFGSGPHGQVLGTVTDAHGAPIAGARVTAGVYKIDTDANGAYDLHLPVGTYDVTASAYGYRTKTTSGVVVAENAKVTENFALATVPRATVSGVVTDGSGHGWPLYAKITVDGVPGGPVFTDPDTGHYSLSLPQDQTYTLHITPAYDGYQAVTQTVTVGTSAPTTNVAVPINVVTCTAPGYKLIADGSTQPFDAPTAPAGWTVTNNGGIGVWQFTDDGHRGNNTGGTGGFAIVDSDRMGSGVTQDTTLTSPAIDVTSANQWVSFDTEYKAGYRSIATVEATVDGGVTWSTLWQQGGTSLSGPAHLDLPVPQSTTASSIQVRFHYIGAWSFWWQLDNVFVGSRTCVPVSGGLVNGQITDSITGKPLTGAVITTPDAPAAKGISAATPDDPTVGDGFYWLFSPVTGSHSFSAAKSKYTTATSTVTVAADATVAADFALAAGQVTVTPTAVAKTVAWGGTATAALTLKNTGNAPATVKIGERHGGVQPQTAGGAPLNRVAGKVFSGSALAAAKAAGSPPSRAPADTKPSNAPWTSIADYPKTIQDNAAAYHEGKIYSAFGYDGMALTAGTYVFDPDTGSWSALASAADPREAPAGAFIGEKFYASGGWGLTGAPDEKTEIYNPATDTWSTGATNPKPHAGAGQAVLNNKLYVIGGCTMTGCGSTDVQVYDPATDTWSAGAAYPISIAWQACGTIAGTIYCAGGNSLDNPVANTYMYDPGTNSWSPKASMPIGLWGSTYAAANGQLLVSGGAVSSAITNQGYAYDPTADSWSALPNANLTMYRSGSACGLYRIGGSPGGGTPSATSEVLPGYTECGESPDVSWLSESPTTVTLQPGATANVTVTVTAGIAEITQPATYTAALTLSTDTPYPLATVPVSMTVNPPQTWGKITGKVTSAVDGSVIPGATVQINSWAADYTLKTAKDGTYGLWLDVRNNPLQLIIAKDGYQPQTKTLRITRGTSTAANFTLKKS
ncbi:MAG: hypothetical protein QOH97_2856 [Actinoplanes sp.]|jgi:N-acetylneuraminic acid mutarotase|nr:hypothetical protein [Actinoplanes sp.]